MARNLSLIRLVPFIALAALALAWNLPQPQPALGADRAAAANVLSGAAIGGTLVPGFKLQIDPAAAPARGDPHAAVHSDTQAFVSGLWGTYLGGDAFRGRLESTPLLVASSYWYLPIIGYPSRHGNRLYVEIKSADGTGIQRYTYFGANPGETLGLWTLDVRRWRGGNGRVVLEDGTSDQGGWLGVGAPIASDQAGATIQALVAGPNNTELYWLTGLVLLVLVFLPGIALRHWRPHSGWAETVLLPLPGVLLLAGYGLLLWLFGAGTSDLGRHLFLLGEAALAASCCWPGRGRAALGKADWIWAPYLAVAALAAGYCAARRPVTQEQNRLTDFQSRMVASPPDHLIPYATAVYFHAGYKGWDHSEPYFGGTSMAAGGPLAPWIINAGFNLFRLQPSDPPGATADAWPAAADGFYVARWVAFFTNACAIAGVAALTLALGRRLGVGLLWAAAAPVTFLNVAFAWPKLFAAYFILLAAADCVRGKSPWRLAAWTALAQLAHPLGGFFAVPVLMLTARSRGWLPAARYAAGTALFLAPWLIFKSLLSQPQFFLSAPLGDGHGFEHAAGFGTWLAARGWNLYYTLIPGAFSLSSQMRSWTWGPLAEPARWAIQYAKTLPGNLGYVGCAVTYFAVARLGWAKGRAEMKPELRRFLGWFVLPSLVVMLLFWGFSRDGLGRDCLEPLSLALIAWTAAARPLSIRAGALVLGFVAVETMTMVVFGFL